MMESQRSNVEIDKLIEDGIKTRINEMLKQNQN